MNYSVGIVPFKDYWLNCSFNMMFSIFISAEPSFRLAAYLNDYSYLISEIETPSGTNIHYPTLHPMKNFEKKYLNQNILTKQPINFKYDQNYIGFLKDLITKRTLLAIGVDLFYWIPNSVCWGKHHWEHYSFINGFDDEKKLFYVLDESTSGYNEHDIPEERLYASVKNSPLDPHGYIYKFLDEIGPFKFSLSEVISNAQRLSNELKQIRIKTLLQLSGEDLAAGHMCDLMSMYLHQIVNRHKANQFLFQTLYKKNMINMEAADILIRCSKALQDGWLIVKNLLVKAYIIKNKNSELIYINESCKDLFFKEFEMWNKFISCIEK